MATQVSGNMEATGAERAPATLWLRTLAFAVDYVLIAGYLILLAVAGTVVGAFAPGVTRTLFGSPLTGQATGFLLVTLPVTLYFTFTEASPRQASWGKGKLQLRVETLDGGRLSRGRSLARTALKFVPWELSHTFMWRIAYAPDPSAPIFTFGFSLVWIIVGVNVLSLVLDSSRRTLYDRLSRTSVVRAG